MFEAVELVCGDVIDREGDVGGECYLEERWIRFAHLGNKLQ